MAELFKKRVLCEEKECNRYELLTEKCLEIHKLVYHKDQQFEDGHRPIEHSCRKENEKLKWRTLDRDKYIWGSKYRNEKSNKYPNIEIFLNSTSLTETEIQENHKFKITRNNKKKNRKKNNTGAKRKEKRFEKQNLYLTLPIYSISIIVLWNCKGLRARHEVIQLLMNIFQLSCICL